MAKRLHALWYQRRLWIWSDAEGEDHPRDGLGEAAGTPDILRLEGRAVRATVLPPAEAVEWLRRADGPEASESVRFWGTLAEFLHQLLAAGRFYPDVEASAEGLRGRWRPWLTAPALLKWLDVMVQAMPPVCLQPQEGLDPAHLIESFLGAATDALVRKWLGNDEFFQNVRERNRRSEAPPEGHWIAAMLSADAMVEAPGDELTYIAQTVRQWVGKLEARQSGPLRLDFILEEPPEDQDDPATAQWALRFRLCLTEESEALIDAAELWAEQPSAVLGRRVLDQRLWMVEQLQAAAAFFPPLERISEQPSEIQLSTPEAHLLLSRSANELREQGYGVIVPPWMVRREVGLHMLVHPMDGDELPPLNGQAGGFNGESTHGADVQIGLRTLVDFDWQVAIGDLRLSAEAFQKLLAGRQPLVKFQGQWIEVDEQAAAKAMAYLEKNLHGRTTLGDAIRTSFTAGRDAGLPILGLTGTGWLEHLLDQTPTMQLQAMAQPQAFEGQMRPYQLRGLDWLGFLDRLGIGACLADDMGLGKTIQLIALLLREREQKTEAGEAAANQPPTTTLLFAPTSVVGNWARELERFAPDLKVMVHHGPDRLHGKVLARTAVEHDVVITSYALAHRDREDLEAIPWHRLVLDEAQKIKNPSAAATKAISALSADHRIALTGTPIENHLSELWSIMEVLNPGLLGSATEFRQRFAQPIERGGNADRSAQLRRLIQPFILRRTKSDPQVAAELPEKQEMRVFCNLTQEQATLYQRITDDMLRRIDAAGGIRRRGLILSALTRLKQVCNHPRLVMRNEVGPLDGRSGKCERLVEMMEEILQEGDAALIFTQYRQMGHLLEQILKDRLGQPLQFLHGGTPAHQRDEMVETFNAPGSPIRIFILSLRAGGVGLNLTAANHVFHFDRWWNPAIEQQATDRAYRIGQTRKVQVHKFVCVGTVEERIDRMLQKKLALAEQIVGAGDEWLTSMSTEQLRDTLRLDQDAVGDF